MCIYIYTYLSLSLSPSLFSSSLRVTCFQFIACSLVLLVFFIFLSHISPSLSPLRCSSPSLSIYHWQRSFQCKIEAWKCLRSVPARPQPQPTGAGSYPVLGWVLEIGLPIYPSLPVSERPSCLTWANMWHSAFSQPQISRSICGMHSCFVPQWQPSKFSRWSSCKALRLRTSAHGSLMHLPSIMWFRELQNICHHHPESKKRQSSEDKSGSIHTCCRCGYAREIRSRPLSQGGPLRWR